MSKILRDKQGRFTTKEILGKDISKRKTKKAKYINLYDTRITTYLLGFILLVSISINTGMTTAKSLSNAFSVFKTHYAQAQESKAMAKSVNEAYEDYHSVLRPVVWSCMGEGCEKEYTNVVEEEVETVKEVVIETGKEYSGKASWYGATIEECLGCMPYYTESGQLFFKTNTGEVFDDTQMTLAFNHLPLNTEVLVTNVDNGASMVARVNDTGNFNEVGRQNYYAKTGRYPTEHAGIDKIADLSKGLKQELNCADTCNVTVKEVK